MKTKLRRLAERGRCKMSSLHLSRQPLRGSENCANVGAWSDSSRNQLLLQLETENAELRNRAVDIALQIQAFYENN
jgi:hypothetical protein